MLCEACVLGVLTTYCTLHMYVSGVHLEAGDIPLFYCNSEKELNSASSGLTCPNIILITGSPSTSNIQLMLYRLIVASTYERNLIFHYYNRFNYVAMEQILELSFFGSNKYLTLICNLDEAVSGK